MKLHIWPLVFLLFVNSTNALSGTVGGLYLLTDLMFIRICSYILYFERCLPAFRIWLGKEKDSPVRSLNVLFSMTNE